jgi:type I restriction enzyme M protein
LQKVDQHSICESGNPVSLRDRRGQTLFIDARKLGTLVDRVHRELGEGDIEKIVGTYHAWRADQGVTRKDVGSAYVDVPGFCKSATTEEIAAHGHVLTPGRYVGAEDVEEDGEPFEEKMARLVAELSGQFKKSAELEREINKGLQGIGYGR